MDKDCPHCESKLVPCFTQMYCPNDKCYSNRGRPEFHKAHKVAEYQRAYEAASKITVQSSWTCSVCRTTHSNLRNRCYNCLAYKGIP